MTSRATSSSKRQRNATSRARSAPEKKTTATWDSDSSVTLSTSAANTVLDPLAYTYSVSPSYTPNGTKPYGILKNETNAIRSFLRRMERTLTSMPSDFFQVESTGLSGHGEKITLTLMPFDSLERGAWYDSSLKKPRRKSSRNGRSSRGSK